MQEDPTPPPEQPQYAAYYRPGQPQGSWEKLQALSDGYFGLNYVFLINIGLGVGLRTATSSMVSAPMNNETLFEMWGLFMAILGIAVALFTYPFNKKIAFGKGWQRSSAVIASVLMGLNSALCCGIIGYVVMQQIAYAEMKRMGVGASLLGLRKANVQAVIEQLKAQQAHSQMPPPPIS